MDQTTVEPAAQPVPTYTEVTLKRAVTVEGHVYRAGLKHVVDATILAAFGDAIATQRKFS